jgi:hypothetical protein
MPLGMAGTSHPIFTHCYEARAGGKCDTLIFCFSFCYTHHLQHHIPHLKVGIWVSQWVSQVYVFDTCYTFATPWGVAVSQGIRLSLKTAFCDDRLSPYRLLVLRLRSTYPTCA